MNERLRTPAQIRAQAARLVAQVCTQGKSLDALLANVAGTPSERGLLRTLVYGTVRWQIRLQGALDRLANRPPRELAPEVRALILVGLYQLLHSDIAAHAAVAETVEATRFLKQPRAAGLVNAVLRRCQREAKQLTAILDSDLAIRTAHPPWLVDRLRQDWPNEYPRILDANNQHPPMWLRVNAQRGSVGAYLQRLRAAGFEAQRSEYAQQALLLSKPVDVWSLPGFESGEVSVQDAAAQLAAPLLDPRPGDRVLDACAAPGGKTAHLREFEPDIAHLLALDNSPDRLRKVHENLERLGLTATVRVGDAAEPAGWWDGQPFDRILLDVPCSATGVIRRHPDIKLLRRPEDIEALARRQIQLLRRLWPLLTTGGRLVYASCSALRAETAHVIATFLAETHTAVDVTPKACRAAGIPTAAAQPGLAIRAGEAQMDGFYYACLEKSPD